jgi:WavE lipopolysaccharide synthesis.
MSVSSGEISVLVQGSVDEKTKKCIASVRRHLPGSQVVLSTWKGYDLSNIEYDALCEQDDPGANKIKCLGNIYREIIGRKAGLQKCDRLYTLIIRSDSEVINLNFVRAFEEKLRVGKYEEYRFLKDRVMMCSAGWIASSLFFLNDWFFFGKTEDIKDMFDLPVIDESLLSDDEKGLPDYNSPHEYLATQFVKKHMDLDYTYEDFSNNKYKYKGMWEKIIVENFKMLGFYDNYGITNLKEPYHTNEVNNAKYFIPGMKHLMLNFEFEDWYNCYNRLYEDKIKIKPRAKWFMARIGIGFYRKLKPKRVCRKNI